jgi:hypothetical protein
VEGTTRSFWGKLELSKCFHYILSWKFNELGDAIPTSIEDERLLCPQIVISDSTTNTDITIHQKEINEYHPTLGCKKTMTGCNKVKQIALKQKCDNTGIKVKNSGFN